MQIGQRVQWQSQGKGSLTTKIGKIVRVVKEGEMPWKIAKKEFPDHQLMFSGWELPGGKKVKEAYLIEVVISPTKRARLYMPVPNKLMKN